MSQRRKSSVGALSAFLNPRTSQLVALSSVMRFTNDAEQKQMVHDYEQAVNVNHNRAGEPNYNINLTSDQIQVLVKTYCGKDTSGQWGSHPMASAIRQLLAENPNTDLADILVLNTWVPDRVQLNPALSMYLLTDPTTTVPLSPGFYQMLFTVPRTVGAVLERVLPFVQSGVGVTILADYNTKYTRNHSRNRLTPFPENYSEAHSLWLWAEQWIHQTTAYILLRRSSIPNLLKKTGPIEATDTLSSKDVSKSKSSPPGVPELEGNGYKTLLVHSEKQANELLNGLRRGTQEGKEIFAVVPIQVSFAELQPLTVKGIVLAPMRWEDRSHWAALRESTLSRARVDLTPFEGGQHRAPAPPPATSKSGPADIARSIRDDIKALTKESYPGLQCSVNRRHYNSITVEVTKLPSNVARIYHLDGFLKSGTADWMRSSQRMKDATDATYSMLMRDLSGIVDKYHWDRSDIQTDYHNSNFYRDVRIDWELDKQQLKLLWQDLLDYVQNPKINPEDLVFVVDILQYEGTYLSSFESFKLPLMQAIGSNPQCAKLSKAQYARVESWCGVNLTVPLRRAGIQRRKIKLHPQSPKRAHKPSDKHPPVPRPKAKKRRKIKLGPGIPTMPPSQRDHGLPSLPPRPSSLELTHSPAPKSRRAATEDEKRTRRELARERRKPMILPRDQGPYLIKGVPETKTRRHRTKSASNEKVGEDDGSIVDNIRPSLYQNLMPMTYWRRAVGEMVKSLVRGASNETILLAWSRKATEHGRADPNLSAEKIRRGFDEAFYEDRLSQPFGSGRRLKYNAALDLVQWLVAHGNLEILETLLEVEPIIRDGNITYDLWRGLRNKAWDQMQIYLGQLEARLLNAGIGPLEPLRGSPHDVLVASVLRALILLSLPRIRDEIDRRARIDEFEGYEDEYENVEICQAEALALYDATRWINLMVRVTEPQSLLRAMIWALVPDYDGEETAEDRVLDAWQRLSPQARTYRITEDTIGRALSRVGAVIEPLVSTVPVEVFDLLLHVQEEREIVANFTCQLIQNVAKDPRFEAEILQQQVSPAGRFVLASQACQLLQNVIRQTSDGKEVNGKQREEIRIAVQAFFTCNGQLNLSPSSTWNRLWSLVYRAAIDAWSQQAENLTDIGITFNAYFNITTTPYREADMVKQLRRVFVSYVKGIADRFEGTDRVLDLSLPLLQGPEEDIEVGRLVRLRVIEMLDLFPLIVESGNMKVLSDEEVELLSLCYTDLADLTDARTWVQMFFNGEEAPEDSPLQTVVECLQYYPERIRGRWASLSEEDRVRRVAPSTVGRRRRP